MNFFNGLIFIIIPIQIVNTYSILLNFLILNITIML